MNGPRVPMDAEGARILRIPAYTTAPHDCDTRFECDEPAETAAAGSGIPTYPTGPAGQAGSGTAGRVTVPDEAVRAYGAAYDRSYLVDARGKSSTELAAIDHEAIRAGLDAAAPHIAAAAVRSLSPVLLAALRCIPDGEIRNGCVVHDGATVRQRLKDAYNAITRLGSGETTHTPCPACTGRVRETVGMVCMTCGTDYAPDDDPDAGISDENIAAMPDDDINALVSMYGLRDLCLSDSHRTRAVKQALVVARNRGWDQASRS